VAPPPPDALLLPRFWVNTVSVKVAMALSWAVVVAAELTGAQSGLGYMIEDAALIFRIPVVFIGIMIIGAIGLCLNTALNFAEARFVHWKGR